MQHSLPPSEILRSELTLPLLSQDSSVLSDKYKHCSTASLSLFAYQQTKLPARCTSLNGSWGTQPQVKQPATKVASFRIQFIPLWFRLLNSACALSNVSSASVRELPCGKRSLAIAAMNVELPFFKNKFLTQLRKCVFYRPCHTLFKDINRHTEMHVRSSACIIHACIMEDTTSSQAYSLSNF